jgi:alginate O-acetyltransferase complex protein AlgI
LTAVSTVVDYCCARGLDSSDNPKRRRALLAFSVAINLSFLGFFKYFNFFVDSLASALEALGITSVPRTTLQFILPPGISFYTFQELAYIVDVYHRRIKPARSLIDYALFISLFPHLIAGPIQRPDHLLPQVEQPRSFMPEHFFNGLALILAGLFRKCVIADNCALLANAAFSGRLGKPSLFVLAIGAYAFAWQIYGDFSGYSDIARGSAQLLGFHFMVNFRQPYLAENFQDFWRRWHISLSTWLRDYLYIPLGGSRYGSTITYRNLLVTMLLGGLWHGANWTFVLWGSLHGGCLAVERTFGQLTTGFIRPAKSNWSRWAKRVVIFHLVCLAWIFFRAESVGEAFYLLRGLGTVTWRPEFWIAFKFLALFTAPLFIMDLVLERRSEEYVLERSLNLYRVAFATSMLVLVTLFSGNQINAFIYFQF